MQCISMQGYRRFSAAGAKVSWKRVSLPNHGGGLGRKKCVTLSLFLSGRWTGLFLDRMYGEYSVIFVVLAGDFTLKSLWDHIREMQVRVECYKLAWGSWHIPRHRFIAWLPFHRMVRLTTKTRQIRAGRSNTGL